VILHIVLFRFKPGVTRWGANLGPSVGEYSHVLTVSLDDMPAVDRYLDHRVHRRTISEHIAEIREARLALDIEA
jgi:hypothetical protein